MFAYVIKQFGSPQVFEKSALAVPRLLSRQVLIKIAATSVNPVDVKIRQGKLAAIAPEFPAILHGDVSGVITEIGDKVTEFKPGDQVFTCAGGVRGCGGALAEYIAADADLVALKPNSLTHRETAALPLVSITAWTALVGKARVQAGQQVLIHGATGGVGHIAIQLAKSLGSKVYASCGSEQKAALATELGADQVINYHETDVAAYVKDCTQGQGFDVVFDTVGGDNIQKSFQAAALNANVVTTSARTNQDLSLMHSKGLSLHVVFMLIPLLHNIGRSYHGEILRQIASLAEQSHLRPLLDKSHYHIDQISDAHAQLESGDYVGKIVVEI